MNDKVLKLEKIIPVLLAAAVIIFDLWIYFQNIDVRYPMLFKAVCLIFSGIVLVLVFGLRYVYRKIVLDFSDKVCGYVDELSKGSLSKLIPDEDTLTSKIQMKLDKLADITYANVSRQANQKKEVQQMVSDISHQLKTPIANITMYSAMLEDEKFTQEQKKEFTRVVANQVGKLEFLVDALAKMSRLESHLIQLEIKPAKIFETLFYAVSQVGTKAENKNIDIHVDCDEALLLPHDAKWTCEALFNILDNAVKYTPEGGKVSIHVEPWELFTKIDIKDTGIGISSEHYQDIFKRFYREGKVHLTEGLGIGLYLSRQIISEQGGYIKVKSKENEGSVFSVFLPNEYTDAG